MHSPGTAHSKSSWAAEKAKEATKRTKAGKKTFIVQTLSSKKTFLLKIK